MHVNDLEFESFVKHSTWNIDSLDNATQAYYSPYYSNDHLFYIPYRVAYSNNETSIPTTSIEIAMDLCIRTRHHDGKHREAALRTLFADGYIDKYVVLYL